MKMRLATEAELPQIKAFYDAVIDTLQDDDIDIDWTKDGYPSADFLQAAIAQKELYLAIQDGIIAGAFVLNRDANEGYGQVQWPVTAQDNTISIVHTLATAPQMRRQGVGKAILEWIVQHCREQGDQAVRLDVVTGNMPASRLYLAVGFYLVDTIVLRYSCPTQTVECEFELYEYKL